MLLALKWFLTKNFKTFNIPADSPLAYLSEPVVYKSPVHGKTPWEREVQQVKLLETNLFADVRTRSNRNVLILPLASTNLSVGKLIVSCRKHNMKAWVLESLNKYGSKKEFERAIGFFKEKPLVIACGSWYNFIQDSKGFDTALVIDPLINIEKTNAEILEGNAKKTDLIQKSKENNEKQATETSKAFEILEVLPEFKESKNLFLYFMKKSDTDTSLLRSPGLIDTGGRLGSEPLGSKEFAITQILLKLIDHYKSN